MNYKEGVYTCWTLHDFSHLGIRLDTATLIFCSTLIFTQHLLLITTAKNSALQKIWHHQKENSTHTHTHTQNSTIYPEPLVEPQWTSSCGGQQVDYHCISLESLNISCCGTSLVAQCLRIRLPMQGTQVWALVREDATCRGATKPTRHNYWACALEPVCHNYWSPCATTTEPACLEPVLCNKRSHWMRNPRTATKSSPRSPQLEKTCAQQRRPNAAKNK